MMQRLCLHSPRECFDFAQHERSTGHETLEHLILSEVEGRGRAHQTNDEGAA